jgi:hypothetical protein
MGCGPTYDKYQSGGLAVRADVFLYQIDVLIICLFNVL